MSARFIKLSYNSRQTGNLRNTVGLSSDNWDDFGFKTNFSLSIYDNSGSKIEIGNVKIGYKGQLQGWTAAAIPESFATLDQNFFSLGQDPDYYKNLTENLPPEECKLVLQALGDVAYSAERLALAQEQPAFHTSLLRNINVTTIEHQYRRILKGEAPLTPYDFSFIKPLTANSADLTLNFTVIPNSKPSSNIHILIGRNGVGKTTILNNMVQALLAPEGTISETGHFIARREWYNQPLLSNDDFAGVVSVSFSAFDIFEPPPNQDNPEKGMRYRYVGLKKNTQETSNSEWPLKDKTELCRDLARSLSICLALQAKRARWVVAIAKLESDFNFEEMNLLHLLNEFDNDTTDQKICFQSYSINFFRLMSSGHTIVLLTITQLIETVEEKTLVLIDEPESHLHPPLLSAFTRALADLLTNRNAVAIIATHSPVVLQEVPRSCVSIINRTRLVATVDPPEAETFAENVGTLTRHVFGLEVKNSGFHELLSRAVADGKTYDEIENEYSDQIGYEGKALVRSLTISRDKG
ncbi:MAG: AAA family ATPase [Pseudomonas sp.]|jgi:ABC-type multidrug transport system ATPase subunit|uniref:AAA family ATPase n=1 Tax=Pseudomonas sp. TaxID=306 RepID=UPI0039828B58